MKKIENSKILVTGGAGHVGSHIVDDLLNAGAKSIVIYDNFSQGRGSNIAHLTNDKRITIFRNDVRDYADIRNAMDKCDYVFHTASILLLEARNNVNKAIEVNISGTLNVILSAIETGVKKIIFSSTGSVYGEPIYIPMDESHPYNSETIYGTTKIAGEHLLRDYQKSHGLAYVGLRYFNVYGLRQHYKGAYAQIIPRWYDSMISGEKVTIFGDGSQTIDATFVTDISRANIIALESDYENDFFNVGYGKETSILELFEVMAKLINYKMKPEFINQDVNLVKKRLSSIEKAKKELGFTACVNLEEGLLQYIDWRKSTKL